MPDPPQRKLPTWTRLATIGVEYAAAVAGFGLIGWWIDIKWDSSPWGVLIGAALGLIGATYNLLRETLNLVDTPRRRPGQRDEDERGR
jgi:F0F1-type ATP synthase assembly protein I